MSNFSPIDQVNLQHRLGNLLQQTGYQLIQLNGQRIFSPPQHLNFMPQRGSEVFVGKLPRNLFEDEIVPLFSMVGRLYKIRLMLDFSGLNRGYCFVTYFTQEEAKRAVDVLHGFEVRPRKFIGVYKSVDNCRLFVGGIVQDKTREEVMSHISYLVEGVIDVIMYQAHYNTNQNRGYVFVEFESHKSAAMARRKLAPGAVLLFGQPIVVDWADPIPEVDQSIMSKVTKLYIRNLDVTLTQETLEDELKKYVSRTGIVRVYKMNDYAFVHFISRVEAETALNVLNGALICGNPLEVTWARPRIYSKNNRMHCFPENFCTSIPPKMRKQLQAKWIPAPSDQSLHTPSTSRSPSCCTPSCST